ncbi:MAG TPA: AAA family ATPase [Gallionella sp.]|nr:AAA family ATPase [Gallionella sp.]
MKIAVLSPNKSQREGVVHILQEGEQLHVVLSFDGSEEQLEAVADQQLPDLIVIESAGDGQGAIAALGRVSQRHAGMSFIVLCEQVSAENLIQLMHLGVRDVLPVPVARQALVEAVARVEQKHARTEMPLHKGKVLAFIACKGGSGATFLASNLGYVLATEYGKRVALIDLNLQFGDASLFVSDKVPTITLSDVVGNISRLDASLFASSMVKVLPNFGVLAAPENPAKAADVWPSHIEVLMRLAVAEYDYVILDIGRNLEAVSIKALDHADLIFPVLQETLPFVRDAKRIVSTLQSLDYSKDKIHLIVNRYEKGGDIQLADVERTLGMKVMLTFPNSYVAVSASVNQGVPILKMARADPVAKILLKLGHDLELGEEEKTGWFGRLFSRA